MASIISDTAGLGCSKRDNARTNTGTGTKMKDDANEPERAEGKVVDITMPNKTNKTLILVSY